MSIKALLLAVVGLIVAGFYALESYLSFQANGFTAPLLVKLLICGAGLYLLVRNIKRIKGGSGGSSANAA
ncbi:hypothetical protein [Luteimonas arsenica]|uniref:hypothetical protein n=1 Tax=Luteimonas arsenica TaxID=1586242 RepID=UPI00105528A6|nr:hypothetical protein [Luteimonas arsenica]